jgi:hypothetical protein
MTIDFTLPSQKWTLTHKPYQNNTERKLLGWAKEAVAQEFKYASHLQGWIEDELRQYAASHKSRVTQGHSIKVELGSDFNSVIITVPRYKLDDQLQITEWHYETFITIVKDGTQTKE